MHANKPLETGIGSYTFTWAVGVAGQAVAVPMTAFDLIEKASELNATVVQFADNMPLDRFPQEKLHDLLQFAESKSIRLEVGSKGLTPERIERYISIAQALHSNILRFVIDDNDFQPSPEQVVNIIRPYIPSLEAANIRLALENHDRLKTIEFVHIIQACDSPYVGICLDTVNSLGIPEGTGEVIRELLPYTFNLHVKDFIIERLEHKMGFRVEGVPAGKGKLDIPFLMRELSALGKCKTAILELWTPFGASLEETIVRENNWAIESMLYLNQLHYF